MRLNIHEYSDSIRSQISAKCKSYNNMCYAQQTKKTAITDISS